MRSPILGRSIVAMCAGACLLVGLWLPGTSLADSQRSCGPARVQSDSSGTAARLTARVSPAAIRPASPGDAATRGGGCPPVTVTYSDASFDGDQYQLPPGMVETEIAATTYSASPGDFPLLIDLSEIIFAQNHFNPTVTQWTYLVWEGNPQTGTLVASFSSDGLILPHVELPVGAAQAVLLQVTVDPGDPEQIIVLDDGSHTFSVGFQIAAHNNPPTSPCTCSGGALPAVCCPIDVSSNAFPAMDNAGPNFGADNWLWVRDCPGGTPGCFIGPGWLQLSIIPAQFVNDWMIRVTYTPLGCTPSTGACCLPDDTCEILTEQNCLSQGGDYRGEDTTCVACEGACCLPSGGCTDAETPTSCGQAGGVFQGPGTNCASIECLGACCQLGGACLDSTLEGCDSISGTWQGPDTQCAQFSCPTTGACCLGDGGCVDDQTLQDCDAAGGVLKPGQVCFDAPCVGACCVPSSGFCDDRLEANCSAIPGAVWLGPDSACTGPSQDACPTAACCMSDGSCVDDNEPNCLALGGLYMDGESCATADCPDPIGACCYSNDTCLEEIEATCLGFGGTWMGAGTICPDACSPCAGPPDGDLSGEGLVNGLDVHAFVDAVLGSPTPDQICAGDFDGSGDLGTGDIPGVVNALLTAP